MPPALISGGKEGLLQLASVGWCKLKPVLSTVSALETKKTIKPSLRPPGGSEPAPVIGPRGGSESCDWLDHLDQI